MIFFNQLILIETLSKISYVFSQCQQYGNIQITFPNGFQSHLFIFYRKSRNTNFLSLNVKHFPGHRSHDVFAFGTNGINKPRNLGWMRSYFISFNGSACVPSLCQTGKLLVLALNHLFFFYFSCKVRVRTVVLFSKYYQTFLYCTTNH